MRWGLSLTHFAFVSQIFVLKEHNPLCLVIYGKINKNNLCSGAYKL